MGVDILTIFDLGNESDTKNDSSNAEETESNKAEDC